MPGALGLAAGLLLADGWPAGAAWTATGALLVGAAALRHRRRWPWVPFIALFGLGAARGTPTVPPLPIPAAGALVVVDGTVTRALLPSLNSVRPTTERARWFTLGDVVLTDRHRRVAVTGVVRVRAPVGDTLLVRGARVRVHGELFTARPARNPGERDTRERWRRQGIAAGLLLKGPSHLTMVSTASVWDPRAQIDTGRAACLRGLRRSLSPSCAGLTAALVLGIRDGLDSELVDAVAATGTTEILHQPGEIVGSGF